MDKVKLDKKRKANESWKAKMLADYEAGTLDPSRYEMRTCLCGCKKSFPVIKGVHSVRKVYFNQNCVNKKWQKGKDMAGRIAASRKRKATIVKPPKFDRTKCLTDSQECADCSACLNVMALADTTRGFKCPRGV